MEEPLIPPNSSRGTQNKVAIPLPSINQTTTKRQENAGGKTLVDVRYHPTAVDVLASRLNGPVLEKLFAAHIIGPDGTASKAKPRRMVKSKMYTVLNPRSRQWKAICFKWSISLVIVFDFVIFVVSTEPVYRLQGRYAQSFHAAEGVTSTIFLLEYLARLYTITESKRFGPHGPINGRLFFMIQLSSLVDVLATLPFFLELVTGWELPQLTFLRTFRLLRILKTSGFVHATDAVWRVLYYNRQIMYMSVFVGLFMILTTATLMFYLRPRQQMKSDDFESLLSTMYLSTLILTGASSVGDLPELPWYTKCVVLLTSAFSIGKHLWHTSIRDKSFLNPNIPIHGYMSYFCFIVQVCLRFLYRC